MASEKKITMREYNGTDYDTLYPKTIAEQVDGVYGKDEVLSNSTKALYGLTDSVVPDNVLALLSRFNKGLGNEYVWAKSDGTGIVGYVNSPDENAYPPAVSDGYTYMPLGQVGSKASFASGTYVGTGTYGSNNPNSLTFGFNPKLIIIQGVYNNSGYYMSEVLIASPWETATTQFQSIVLGVRMTTSSVNSYETYSKLQDGVFTWYHPTSAELQQNETGKTYRYVAFG